MSSRSPWSLTNLMWKSTHTVFILARHFIKSVFQHVLSPITTRNVYKTMNSSLNISIRPLHCRKPKFVCIFTWKWMNFIREFFSRFGPLKLILEFFPQTKGRVVVPNAGKCCHFYREEISDQTKYWNMQGNAHRQQKITLRVSLYFLCTEIWKIGCSKD